MSLPPIPHKSVVILPMLFCFRSLVPEVEVEDALEFKEEDPFLLLVVPLTLLCVLESIASRLEESVIVLYIRVFE